MFDDMVNLFNLGAFSDEEKELLKTDAYQKKLAVSIYASILQYLSTNE